MFLDYLKHIRASGKQYFTLKQALDDLKTSKDSVLSAMYRLKKHGDIISPAKGLYVIIPPEHQQQGCLPAEELVPILMKYIGIDYYACLLTAAMFHGASHQKPQTFQIIADKRIKRKLKFGQVHIDCIYKNSIKDLSIQDRVVSTGYLKVSSPEVTAMDLLLYSRKSGGLNHIATVLSELVESIDPDKLIVLADHSSEKVWLQRLGYILEKIDSMDAQSHQKVIDILANCEALKNAPFMPLAPEMPVAGFPRSKKWMIIENTTVESDL